MTSCFAHLLWRLATFRDVATLLLQHTNIAHILHGDICYTTVVLLYNINMPALHAMVHDVTFCVTVRKRYKIYSFHGFAKNNIRYRLKVREGVGDCCTGDIGPYMRNFYSPSTPLWQIYNSKSHIYFALKYIRDVNKRTVGWMHFKFRLGCTSMQNAFFFSNQSGLCLPKSTKCVEIWHFLKHTELRILLRYEEL